MKVLVLNNAAPFIRGGAEELAALLIQLAEAHAHSMDPAALSAAAWSLAALQLTAGRPLMHSMHSMGRG